MIRTFFALEIPVLALNKIIEIRDSFFVNEGKIKWEPIEKLHLTLKFLGDTKEELISKLTDAISKILSSYDCLELVFSEFGLFKKEGKAKILWIGIKENRELLSMSNEIDEVCVGFGFPKERRKFNPHLTILRIKGYEDTKRIDKLINTGFEPIQFTADTVTFFRSILNPNGSVYTPIQKFNLKKGVC